MTRKTAHIISHTHWDREWYLPYESHHLRLTTLMNELMDMLEKDERYRYFHLDGQTIIIDDYLQIYPEQRERLQRLIREEKIIIGPWYVLQDEFLTSSEANVRNLLIGHREAARWGPISKLGYFPDSFGNMGQAPQLLKQAGIEAAVFGRGVKPTGFDNVVVDAPGEYESPYSEMHWESPDGSQVVGVLFANWYSNGNEIPTDAAEAKEFWDRKLAGAEKYASTPELLFMNGCDHQPIQTDLGDALETAEKLFPDVDFVHSTFDQYLEALARHKHDSWVTVRGELRSTRTDGWGTLVNTASARVYLKQMNQVGQTLLEKGAEPLAVMANLAAGKAYPHEPLSYAWKTLMQNHPHDSICGCGVDEIHREMVGRFDKSRHMAEALVGESLQAIGSRIGTDSVQAWPEAARPVALFNTTGWERSGVVTVEVEAVRIDFKQGPSPQGIAEKLDALPLGPGRVVDAEGRAVPARIEDLGSQFGYDLPDDGFRVPYMARKFRLTFEAANVPALGYKLYAWVPEEGGGRIYAGSAAGEDGARKSGSERSADQESGRVANAVPAAQAGESAAADTAVGELVSTPQGMENDFLSVAFAEDGSYTLTDKITGRVFEGLGIYEDCGDIGNEYVFRQPEGDVALTTRGLPARIALVEDEAYRVTYEIVHEWDIPVSAEELFEDEKRRLVPFLKRKAGRSAETAPQTLVTRVSLERSGRGVAVSLTLDNRARDHRLRVLLPTGLRTQTVLADSIFEAAERDIVPAPEWINPSNAQHQQAFVSLSDGAHGLTVANKGLNEYEVLQGGSGTIAVTLLRSVSELGDWGVFPTPEAQCIGEHTLEYAVYPHAGDVAGSGAFALAYQYQTPWFDRLLERQSGPLPAEYRLLSWSGGNLALSALKMSEEHGDVIARWYNLSGGAAALSFEPHFAAGDVYASDILERRGEQAQPAAGVGRIEAEVGAAKIVTFALSPAPRS
ncbi:alpha-mannosidase [Saccharibacillus sp. CPCC 101409]|uniref:alpha-mannosidase n=1 Tax=Saccharibacillus sp. CPCC 101409 TaxID=3058041 RepID=UPI002671D1AC|nr:alpha-mannosidase [Saccharibacillus sp. CPCC 101409]MDO3413168.1 alpha-mannosidase [Saccharibacillus sp. CPCC 101409]